MNILLTGASGFIGRRLVRALAEGGHSQQLLVRSESLGKAQQLFRGLHGVNFVEGDVRRNGVLTRVSATQVMNSPVDAVVHLAGAYDLAITLEEAYTQNVIGTQNMVALAKGLPGAPTFHHVSTYVVNAHREGRVGEDELERDARLPDHYAQTKLQAEAIVRNADWGGARARVYRPGIVIGDSRTGEMDKVDGPYYFYRLLERMAKDRALYGKAPFFPLLGKRGALLPVVPVDVLVAWLKTLVTSPTAHAFRAYHLVSQERIQLEHVLAGSLKAYGLAMAVKPLPLPLPGPLLRLALPRLGIPAEVMGYMDLHAEFARDHLDEDFPGLTAPLVQDYLPRIVEGARELFQ